MIIINNINIRKRAMKRMISEIRTRSFPLTTFLFRGINKNNKNFFSALRTTLFPSVRLNYYLNYYLNYLCYIIVIINII